MKRALIVIMLVVIVSCNSKKMENELREFIVNHEKAVKPLRKETYLAYWNASLSGNADDYQKAETLQLQLVQLYSNKNDFAVLKRINESNEIKDTLLLRQLSSLYKSYLNAMVDSQLLNEIVKMEVAIDQKYSNFRVDIDGKKYSDNEVEEILGASLKDDELRNAWEGHKKIGSLVAADILALVKKRNEMAKAMGYTNYHSMSLSLSEQDPEQIESLFDELDTLTRNSFAEVKKEIDAYLSKRMHVGEEKLMPWHYQNRFFQEGPQIYTTNLDDIYKNKKLEDLTNTYYKSIGLVIQDILDRSDLYEKPGKNQHAYCLDVDNEGDVRVLCNLKSNAKWMNTMLHEYGHAVYDKYIDLDLPYLLREPAHIFTTEAIAMLFGRMASNPQWMLDMGIIDETQKSAISNDCFQSLRMEQLIFSRWVQVMYRFEKSMYANPDQDLNSLWWTLVEKYQMMKKPEGRNEPDWASKIHIATSPCYYHNYMLGELLASQLQHYMAVELLHQKDYSSSSFVNQKLVGEFLLNKVFKPGSRDYWNTMIKNATGEELTAKYYALQFVR